MVYSRLKRRAAVLLAFVLMLLASMTALAECPSGCNWVSTGEFDADGNEIYQCSECLATSSNAEYKANSFMSLSSSQSEELYLRVNGKKLYDGDVLSTDTSESYRLHFTSLVDRQTEVCTFEVENEDILKPIEYKGESIRFNGKMLSVEILKAGTTRIKATSKENPSLSLEITVNITAVGNETYLRFDQCDFDEETGEDIEGRWTIPADYEPPYQIGIMNSKPSKGIEWSVDKTGIIELLSSYVNKRGCPFVEFAVLSKGTVTLTAVSKDNPSIKGSIVIDTSLCDTSGPNGKIKLHAIDWGYGINDKDDPTHMSLVLDKDSEDKQYCGASVFVFYWNNGRWDMSDTESVAQQVADCLVVSSSNPSVVDVNKDMTEPFIWLHRVGTNSWEVGVDIFPSGAGSTKLTFTCDDENIEGTLTFDLTVTEEWLKNSGLTVTWKNYDGSTLEVDNKVRGNSIPEYNGTTPTRPADSSYTYSFKGWSPDIEPVTSNIAYTAQYTATKKSDGSSSGGGKSSGGGGGGSSSGGGGSSASASGTPSSGGSKGATFSPNWFSDAAGTWRIKNNAGQVVTNAWLCDNVIAANGQNVWYLLQADGSMLAAGLVQDNTGNFYSIETTHNGYFGMLRYKDGYYDCNGQQVYLQFSQKHDGTFGAVINADGLEKLKAIYGVTHFGMGNESSTYTASF